MGLKSGSRDAGLDESEEDKTDHSTEDDSQGGTAEGQSTADGESSESAESSAESTESDDRPAMSSIPYKLRREKVNEGREQVPYFLREEIIDAEDELQAALEEMLGENVYKSDYREASMVVAQRNPELVAEVLREWGYDLESV